MSALDRLIKAVPNEWKRPVRRALRTSSRAVEHRLPESAPAPLRTAVRKWSGAAEPVVDHPLDPLGLAVSPGAHAKSTPAAGQVATGRAAAQTVRDSAAADRLARAMHGTRPPGRAPRPRTGGRVVAVLAAPDAVHALEEAGHQVLMLTPGTAAAEATRAEVMVVDLAGFTGVWSGALDAEGVSLWEELLQAMRSARRAGCTVWAVDRGADRFRLGAVALRRLPEAELIRPGAPAPVHHITEDPGAAPTGIVDLLRVLDPQAGSDSAATPSGTSIPTGARA